MSWECVCDACCGVAGPTDKPEHCERHPECDGEMTVWCADLSDWACDECGCPERHLLAKEEKP